MIYGGLEEKGIAFEGVDEALRVPRSDLRLFGKPEAFVRRRMGSPSPTAPTSPTRVAAPSFAPAGQTGQGLNDRGEAIIPPMLLSPGARLGPYEILAPLGAGAMGEYTARAIHGWGATSRSRCSRPASPRSRPAPAIRAGSAGGGGPQSPQSHRRLRRRLGRRTPVSGLRAPSRRNAAEQAPRGPAPSASRSNSRSKSRADSRRPMTRGSSTAI